MRTLYSVKEAAARLGVGTTTVNRWVKLGDFPDAYKLNPTGQEFTVSNSGGGPCSL